MLMRNQGQPIIDRAVEREKINEDRERQPEKEFRQNYRNRTEREKFVGTGRRKQDNEEFR
jgi:hypothetical protein